MTNDSDPVTVTFSRVEAETVKRMLLVGFPADREPAIAQSALLRLTRAMEPVPAPDPRAPIVAPDPRRTKPWPALKSSQDARDGA